MDLHAFVFNHGVEIAVGWGHARRSRLPDQVCKTIRRKYNYSWRTE